MKKYMTMDRFYDLAKQNYACYIGLEYLKIWMKNNPDKNTVDYFFKDHTRIKESHIKIYNDIIHILPRYDFPVKNKYVAFQIRSYFKWITFKLIDWSSIDWSEISDSGNRYVKWLKEYYNYNYFYCFDTTDDSDKNNRNVIRFLLTSFEGEE